MNVLMQKKYNLCLIVFFQVLLLSCCYSYAASPLGRTPTPALTGDLTNRSSYSAPDGDIFVSTRGNDANPGTREQPLKTIQAAVNMAGPGQVVLIAGGYYNEYVTVTNSGSGEDLRILIASASEHGAMCRGFNIKGSYITLAGFKIEAELDHWVGVFISYCNHVTVQNCLLEECPGGGVVAWGVDYIQVLDTIMNHNGQKGIEVIGSYGLIEGNVISKTVQYHPKGMEPGYSGADADGLRIFGDHYLIRGNRVVDIGDPSDSGNIDPHSDCLQTWDGPPNGRTIMTDTVIENNYFSVNCPAGKGITIESTQDDVAHDIIIRNNIIEFRDEGIAAPIGAHHDIYIYNNVLKARLNDPVWGVGIYLKNIENYQVMNNITVDCHPEHRKIIGGNGTVDYNLSWNSDASLPTLVPAVQAHELRGVNPLFVQYSESGYGANDYHLQSDSPAMDSGILLDDVNSDMEGTARPQGAGPDMGPYESGSSELVHDHSVRHDYSIGSVAVSRWQGHKQAAILMQFDDSTPGQAQLGTTALINRNLVGTWYVNPGRDAFNNNLSYWQNAADHGQELANHTMTHTGADTYEETEHEVGDASKIIWSMRHQDDFSSLIAFNRGGGTAWNEAYLQPILEQYKNVDRTTANIGLRQKSVVAGSTSDEIMAGISTIISAGGIAAFNFHGIAAVDGNPPKDYGNAGVYIEEFEDFLDQLLTMKDDFWNPGFIQACKYVRERESAAVAIYEYPDGCLSVVLTSTMDSQFYNEPLTLLVSLPQGWDGCTVKQNTVPLETVFDNQQLMFDAQPNGGDIIISNF